MQHTAEVIFDLRRAKLYLQCFLCFIIYAILLGEMTFEELNTILENEVKDDADDTETATSAETPQKAVETEPVIAQPSTSSSPADGRKLPRVLALGCFIKMHASECICYCLL